MHAWSVSVAVTHVDVRASAVANARALERSSAQFYALQTDLLMEATEKVLSMTSNMLSM